MTRKEAINAIKEHIDTYHIIVEIEALEMAIEALEQEECEDCISRKEALKLFEDRFIELQKVHQKDKQYGVNWCINTLKDLPSVNPQKPKTRYISIDDVMSVFDDFMCGEVDENGTETFLEMLKDKAESEE